VYFQGPNVKEFPDNAVGSVLFILDCEVIKDPKDLGDKKCCLIVKMPPHPTHNMLFMLTDSPKGQPLVGRRPGGTVKNVQESDGKRSGEPQPKRFKVGSPQKRASQKKRIHFSNEIEVLVEDMMDTTAPAVSETVQGDTTGRGLTKKSTMQMSTNSPATPQTSTPQKSILKTSVNPQTSTTFQTSTIPKTSTIPQTSTTPQMSTTPQTSTTLQTSTIPQTSTTLQTSMTPQMSTTSTVTHVSSKTVTTRDKACQTPPRHSKGKEKEEYTYYKLSDLKPTNKAHVFGVVKNFSEPKMSKGTDYYSSFRLVDESLSSHSDVQCTLFHNTEELLPHIRAVGDIVRLHRVVVKTFNGNTQISGKKIFSCLVFDGRKDQPIVSRTGNTEFTFTNKDKKRVSELKEWASKQASLSNSKRLLTLQDLFPGVFFDIVCQVVSTCVVPSNDFGVVRIWDGTKVSINARVADRHGHPSNTDQNMEDLIQDLCVDVVLYNDHMNSMRTLMPGQYLRMHNVHASCYHVGKDQLEVVDLCIHRGMRSGSGVTVLPMDDPDVVQLKEKLSSIQDERVRLFRCVDYRVPVVHQTSVTTICSGHTEVFESIKAVRECQQVPNKHKIRVKFLRIVGTHVEGLVKLVCARCLKSNFPMKENIVEDVESSSPNVYNSEDACPNCQAGGNTSKLKYQYRIKIEVADHSGKIMLLLGDKDADTFFPGLPPCNLYINLATRDQVFQRFTKLSGEEDIFSSPSSDSSRPFLECCIMSYYVGGRDTGQSSGRIAYKIYDTVLEPGA
jgi:hypothetical protein